MDVRLYTIPGSHPGWTVRLMLEYKGIHYQRTDLPPGLHWLVLKAMRFPGGDRAGGHDRRAKGAGLTCDLP